MAVIQDIISLRSGNTTLPRLADPHIVSVVLLCHVCHAVLENGLLPASFFARRQLG